MNNKKATANDFGLSLVEITISMLILGLVMAGLANLFMATKRHTLRAHSRMVQAELGRYFLDRLQMHVREDTWDASDNYLTEGDYRSPNNPYYTVADGYKTASWLDEFDRQLNLNPSNPSDVMYYSAQEVEGVSVTTLRKVKLTLSYPVSAYE